MVRILLIAGHGAGDPGAVGNGLQEATETRDVVNRLAPLLRAKGASVTVLNQAVNAFASIQRGTVPFGRDYDYVFEVHFNAATAAAQGTEIFVTNAESSIAVEQKVMEKLSRFFINRGVKRQNFLVIQTAKNMGMSSALLEVCFVSNASDVAKYRANKQAIAQAICDGIAEAFKLTGTSGTTSSNTIQNDKEIQKEEFGMVCLFSITPGGKALHYFDGKNITTLGHQDEANILKAIYKANYGKDMPVIYRSAAWFQRLKDLSQRKVL